MLTKIDVHVGADIYYHKMVMFVLKRSVRHFEKSYCLYSDFHMSLRLYARAQRTTKLSTRHPIEKNP